MQFIDEVKIYLRSGNGGNGCVSFRREKFVDMGGPDGGDGGRGGHVIIESDPNINTLLHFRYQQHFKAKSGQGGRGANCTGKSAEDTILKVPIGTQVFSSDEDGMMLYDFTKPEERFEILRGGKGGLGNIHFKSSVNQAPRRSTKGEQGSELWVWMRLKLLSDIGIIGLPNAGKSTFLSRVTAARPKIADYPFTTLAPQLGVVKYDDSEFVIADIPGLIEGAHTGYGLGDKFLKHIERCGALLHLVDASSDDVLFNYNVVRNELKSYSESLSCKNEIIALSKCELIDPEECNAKANLLSSATNSKVYQISSHTGVGVNEVLGVMLQILGG
jgi:GTP-binding protein